MTRVIYWRGARCFGGKKQARFERLLGNITFPDVVVLAFNRIDFDWVIINVLECFHEDLHTNRLAANYCFLLAYKKAQSNYFLTQIL